MPALYTIRRTSNEQFYFNLTAENNEIVLTSEHYVSKQAADLGIHSVRANAPNDAAYSRRLAQDGKPYFVLLAANGETIGTSEQYESAQAMEVGIAAVKQSGPSAPVQDFS